jgi:hypothetical protein
MINIASPDVGTAHALPDMVAIPAGTFRMGSVHFYPEERPPRDVTVDGFWMDRYEVTNEAFARFVAETGYVTVAERTPASEDFPGAPPENLVPGSMVFQKRTGPVDLRNYANWCAWVPGANWRHPRGPGSSLEGLTRHPVVHVAYEDAEASGHKSPQWANLSTPRGSMRVLVAKNASDRSQGLSRRIDLPGDGLLLLWDAPGRHPEQSAVKRLSRACSRKQCGTS